ncbi:MAG TPA: hypothetical protein VNC50_18030, partial [Planctomycetia bacterium]|nr:hypothetical protein [Planctomycetia bacterium]
WRQIKAQQAEIEFGNRMQIGLWLRDRVKPEETIYLECLGYIGYFSNGRMLDHPGLCSPTVVAERKKRPWGVVLMIPVLQPDWLVLRTKDEYDKAKLLPGFTDQYEVQKEFDVYPRLKEHYADLWGGNYLEFDSRFTVLKRKR